MMLYAPHKKPFKAALSSGF